MQRSLKSILFFVSLLLAAMTARGIEPFGPNGSYRLIHDFGDEWYVYDEAFESYVPYISERHFSVPAHVIFLNLPENRHYKLLLKCDAKDNFLFIEGALRRKLPANEWVALSIDSLYQVYQKPQIYLTLYGSTTLDDKHAGISYLPPAAATGISTNTDDWQILPRNLSAYRGSLSFLSLIIFGFFTYLSVSYPRGFSGFYNFRNVFTTYTREQSLFVNQSLSRSTISFVVLLSLLLAFLYLTLQSKGVNLFGNQWILQDGDSTTVLFANYLRLTIFFFLGFMFKFFFLNVAARLFNVGKIVDLHFFKLIQADLIFFSLFTLVIFGMAMNYATPEIPWKTIVIISLSIFYFLRTIIIFLAINRTMPIQLLYLISYLCVVEVIPAVVGLQLMARS